MFNIFNMGIGMVLALPKAEAEKAIGILKDNNLKAYIIGEVTNQSGVEII